MTSGVPCPINPTSQGVNMLELLQRWRRDFHRYPEPAWCEYRTSSLIADALQEAGYQILLDEQIISPSAVMGRKIDEDKEKTRALEQGANASWLEKMRYTGVVAVMDTGKPGPCIALRVDLDAVQIGESQKPEHRANLQQYTSLVHSCMHACGHDGHAAIGVVLGLILAQHKSKLGGKLKLIFQPAEEGCRGGKAMALSGVLDDIDCLYALHLGINARSGEIVVAPEGFLCSTKFDVEFIGKAAHAAIEPNAGANALATACSAIGQMLAIPVHRDGMTRINVGTLHAPGERNVIPAYVRLEGETRGESAALNDYVFSAVQRIVQGAAFSHGVDYQIIRQGEAIAIANTPTLVHEITRQAEELGFDIIHCRPFGASEDAGFLLERVQRRGGQAAYLLIGSDLEAGHHNDEFDFDEQSMVNAVILLQRLITNGLTSCFIET